MTHPLSANQDTASKFFRVKMTDDDYQLALQVSPLFMAYLQNKIEAYATTLVEAKLPYSPNPTEQVAAVIAHERLRNYVEAYEELMSEILQASSQSETRA